MPCTDGSAASAVHGIFDLGLRRRLGQFDAQRPHARLLGLLVLRRHEIWLGLSMCDEHGRQAHRRRSRRLDLASEPRHDLVASRLPFISTAPPGVRSNSTADFVASTAISSTPRLTVLVEVDDRRRWVAAEARHFASHRRSGTRSRRRRTP